MPLGFESYNRQLDMQLTENGNYIFIAYKNFSGTYHYTLFTVDPALNTISKLTTQTELANTSTHGFYAPVVDKDNNVVYLPSILAGQDPIQMDLFAVNLDDNTIISSESPFTFPANY